MRTGVLIAIAATLLGIGVLLGLSPSSAMGATKEFSCGSPWVRDAKEMDHQKYIDDLANAMAGRSVWATDYRESCDDALGTRGVFAWILSGLGAVALIGVAIARQPRKTPTVSPSLTDPEA